MFQLLWGAKSVNHNVLKQKESRSGESNRRRPRTSPAPYRKGQTDSPLNQRHTRTTLDTPCCSISLPAVVSLPERPAEHGSF